VQELGVDELRAALAELVSLSSAAEPSATSDVQPPASPSTQPPLTAGQNTRELLSHLRRNITARKPAAPASCAVVDTAEALAADSSNDDPAHSGDQERPATDVPREPSGNQPHGGPAPPQEQVPSRTARAAASRRVESASEDMLLETYEAKIRALEYKLGSHQKCVEEIAALRDMLCNREREVLAFATIVEHLQISLEEGRRALSQAAALKQIVEALAKSSEHEGEVAGLKRELQDLKARNQADAWDHADQLRRKEEEIKSLKRTLHRQVQVSAEREGAIERTCALLKSTNRCLSYARASTLSRYRR
jgi:hypothetical protein